MIQIVNWILTRKCNLKCSYCRIVKNYSSKPIEYPDISHYIRNEMSTEYVISMLNRIRKHNPNSFHIFYGGEPLLRNDLSKIINFCNEYDINYTIISNNSDQVQNRIQKLFDEVEYVKGFTSSVDPDVYDRNDLDDSSIKSRAGINRLTILKSKVSDVVAEITVSSKNIHNLYKLVKDLSDRGISSSITFIDLEKSEYYDFSNIEDLSMLVYPDDVKDHLDKILNDDNLDVHMKDTLGRSLHSILPSNYDCKIERNFHNATIDADGSLRLCLRVRGIETPKLFASSYIDSYGNLKNILHKNIAYDKQNFCELCNWTCPLMSELVEKDFNLSKDLIHSERR